MGYTHGTCELRLLFLKNLELFSGNQGLLHSLHVAPEFGGKRGKKKFLHFCTHMGAKKKILR